METLLSGPDPETCNFPPDNPKLEDAMRLVLDRGLGLREACRSIYGHEMHVSTLSRHVNAKFSPRGTPIRNVRSPKLSKVERYWQMEDARSAAEMKSGRLAPSPTVCRRGEDMTLYGHRFDTISLVTNLLIALEKAAVTVHQSELLPAISVDDYLPPAPIGRWFAGCAADLPPIHPLTSEVIWRERARTYARAV
jgi:hypothetical protein